MIADRLGRLVSELHANYVGRRPPATRRCSCSTTTGRRWERAGDRRRVLAEWEPPTPAGPGASRPIDWFDHGVREVDDVLRFMLTTGDGAYGEGAYYYRYTAMNLCPRPGLGASRGSRPVPGR